MSLLAAGPLSADEVALRISLHQPADGLLGLYLQEFKKMVEAETKGAVKVSIYDKHPSIPIIKFQKVSAVGPSNGGRPAGGVYR